MKKYLLLFLIYPTFLFSQNICDITINPVCSSDTFDLEAPNSSFDGFITSCDNEVYAMQDVAWYHVRILQGTTFTFMLQIQLGDDYDFAVWLNPDCANLGPADRASFIHEPNAGVTQTGLKLNELDTCEGAGNEWANTPGMVRHLDVQPGDDVYIMIYRPPGVSAGDFSVVFEGTGGDAELDCTILGNSYGKCDVDGNQEESFVEGDFLTDLNDDFPGSQYEFYENQENAEDGTGAEVIFPHTINLADNPSELFIRVESAGGNFQRVVQTFLYVNEIPQLTTPIDLSMCDIDGDEAEEFNLTEAESDLVADPSLFTFRYYDNPVDAQNGGLNFINPANAYESGTATIYVRVETGPLDGNDEGCFSIGEINLVLTDEIETEFDIIVSYCLDAAPADLSLVSDNGITGTWNPAIIDTSGLGTTTYTFTPDAGQCATEYEFEVEIIELTLTEFDLENSFCLNSIAPAFSNTSDNGITGTWNPAVIDTGTLGTATYTFTPDAGQCADEFEFEIEITELILPEFTLENSFCIDSTAPDFPLISENGYQGTWNPATIDTTTPGATIYTFTPDAAECIDGYEIEIEIIAAAVLANIPPISLCDSDFDGNYEYDLTDLNELLINPTTGLTFAYYASQQDFNNDISIPQNQWDNYSLILPTTILVVATTEEGCRSESVEIDFVEGNEVQHNAGPFDMIGYCEGETIDLTQYEADMGTEPGINFSYYESIANAENGTNSIQNTNPYSPTGNGSIFVRLEKEDRCPVILEISYELLPSPSIEGLDGFASVICEGEETIEIEANSDDPNATYLWEWGNGQNQTNPIIQITQPGTYTLTVTGENGCETTEQLTITPSPQPIITLIESGNNYIIVTAESGGGGGLEYSLNGVIWQDNPRFDNLIKGEIYTVYVRENGCMVTSYQVVILDITNFVSPNGDGYNDTWAVRGIEVTPEATIKIFDRYGKLFVDTNFDGDYVWDGKYNGSNLPSGDYWYIMDVPSDGIITAKKFVGHVSIRNQ